MDAPVRVDLFVDIVCPWCFVGNERMERVLAGWPGPVTLTHHPFLLDPATPPEGRDVAAMLRRKYGVPAESLWARVSEAAQTAGIDLDLSKQPFSYPTLRAHTLVRRAEAKGTQRRLVRDLFRSYFLEARNIHDVDVLAEVGTRHGFEADEVRALLADDRALGETRAAADSATAAGISGVPFFVFDERLALSGAQPEPVIQAALEQVAAEQRW
jgi:predicted DsbA family dithiol-disulfide isomerase